MASQLFTDAQLSPSRFEELRAVVAHSVGRLNEKRKNFSKRRFAHVYVTEVLTHPSTRDALFTVSYSEMDRNAPRFVRKAVVAWCIKE